MLIYSGKPIIEGIDSINLLLQPYLYCYFTDKQLDKFRKILIFTKIARFQISLYESIPKPYYYLHISGEYINHELPIIDSIINAIYTIFFKEKIVIEDFNDEKPLTNVSKEMIRDNLHLFIKGISEVEFCFDFEESNVKITEDQDIIKKTDEVYSSFKKSKLKNRDRRLINEEFTYYSCDYTPKRKSTLKLYNREKCLLKKNNEYPITLIKNYPNKMRLEFTLKKNINSSYLSLDNFSGSYHDIITRFTPYLAKLFRKYFLGNVLIFNTATHKYFDKIYALSLTDNIKYKKLLKNTRYDGYKYKNPSNFPELITLLRKENRKVKKNLMLLPDDYSDNNDVKDQGYIMTPYDLIGENNIYYDDNFFDLE